MAIIEHAGYYEEPMYGVSHIHTSCEIMCVVVGRLSVTINGQEIRLTNGHCLLIKSRCHHTVKAAENAEYKRFISIINPWELRKQLVRPDLFTMLTDTGKSGFIHLENGSKLYGGFEKMTEIFKSGGNLYEELSAALSVLSEFYESIRPRESSSAKNSAGRISDMVRFYIEQNYADNIKVSRLAADNFISEGYLSHAFKAETGMPPREYLSHIRCTRAYELICHTTMKFADIAGNTGFCCANDMSRKGSITVNRLQKFDLENKNMNLYFCRAVFGLSFYFQNYSLIYLTAVYRYAKAIAVNYTFLSRKSENPLLIGLRVSRF